MARGTSRSAGWLGRWLKRDKQPPTELEILRLGIAPPKAPTTLARWFPPRQFLLRGPHRTIALDLSPRLQAAGVAAVALGTLAFFATSLVAAWHQRAAEELAFQVETLHNTTAFERSLAAADRKRLQELGPQLARSVAERDRAAAAAFIAGESLAETKSDVDRLANERLRLAQERDKALAERDAALAANRQLLHQLDADTRNTIAQVERIIAATGLDMRRAKLPTSPAPAAMVPVAAEPKGGPRGGPFVRWQGKDRPPEETEPGRIDGLTVSLDRLKALHNFIAHVPIGNPLPHLDITSGFGFRLDPFSRFAAMHEGVDMRAAPGTAVRATAAGRVVHAGWRAEYGLLVEIDHGFGLLTRYAHLSSTSVKVGDAVALHQPIGLIGATGRTTGQHLHYEIRVDGQARNPVQFLKADRNQPRASHHVR